MDTTKKILNPQAITSLYGKFVSLHGAELLEFHLKRDEPRLKTRFQILERPHNPPTRWPKNYDVVYIDLSFIGISDLYLNGWGGNNVLAGVELLDINEKVKISLFSEENFKVSFLCDWIQVGNVSPGLIGSP